MFLDRHAIDLDAIVAVALEHFNSMFFVRSSARKFLENNARRPPPDVAGPMPLHN
jgi:hypothetical protein